MKISSDFEVPGALEFGYCRVGTQETRTFTITNKGSYPGRYAIYSEIFEFSPKKGTLQPNQSEQISVRYIATEAKTVIEAARVSINDDWKTIKTTAIGKYPFVALSTHKLDYGELLTGLGSTKELILRNPSLVAAEFEIEKMDEEKDVLPAFTLECHKKVIPPNSSFLIKIKYTPTIVGLFSCTHYKVKIKGGNEDEFTCMGQALGLEVSLSAKSIQFGDVTFGNSTNRVLYITNSSSQPATFQFHNDKKNVFSFSKKEGIIPPRSDLRIIITFTPTATINFYERIFCMVKNHQVLFVDLIGTCYDLLNKPYPLHQRHVDMYRHRMIMGTHKGSPVMDEMMKESKRGTKNMSISEMQQSALEEGMELNEEIPIDDPNFVARHKEMFVECSNEARGIYIKEDLLDFGYSQPGIKSDPRELTIVNNLNYDAKCYWVIPSVPGSTGKANFVVNPVEFEIPRKSERSLKIVFNPTEPNVYYFHRLQLYTFRITGYDNRLKKLDMKDPTRKDMQAVTITRTALTLNKYKKKGPIEVAEEVEPPLVLTIPIVGHSFPPGSQPFLPMLEVNPSNVVYFLPAALEESVYQIVQLANNSDTPIYYMFLPDPSKTFKIFPSSGIIEGKSFALICFEFNPRMYQPYSFVTQCILNHSASFQTKIQLVGYCYIPQIRIEGESKIYYPPTFMGVASKEKLRVKNDSLVQIDISSHLPEKYREEISFFPQAFRLRGNEIRELACTFIPKKPKPYAVTANLIASGVYEPFKDLVGYFNPGSGNLMKQGTTYQKITRSQNILILGAGADGYIEISPESIDYGTVKVGDQLVRDVTLQNKSKANVYVELSMIPKEGEELDEALLKRQFKYEFVNGVINAHSKKVVSLYFKPNTRCNFDMYLMCVAKDKPAPPDDGATGGTKDLSRKKEFSKTLKLEEQKSFCQIFAKGDFPLIKLMDIRNESVSTATLCDSFNFGPLNKELLSPLSAQELEFNNADKTSKSVAKLQKDLKRFEWHFGKIPQNLKGHTPRRVIITLKNIGGVNSQFMFRMPNESEIELEPWMDPGEPSREEAFESEMLQKGLFEVQPKCGTLKPNEQLDIEAFYFPKEVGEHNLNIFFQVLNGKPLIIRFAGETLRPRRGYLQLRKDFFQLPPTPINLITPIIYPLEVKNLGSIKFVYEVDEGPLEDLAKNNYNFNRIFILPSHKKKKVEVLPNRSEFIYVKFHPIEAKKYSIELPILVKDIEGSQNAILKLSGEGYHPVLQKTPPHPSIFSSVPLCRSNLKGLGPKVSFSLDEIDFGEVDIDVPCRRMVVMYNHSEKMALNFIFSMTGLVYDDVLLLEPFKGKIPPKSHIDIKLTLKASQIPSSYEGELECLIDWIPDTGEEGSPGPANSGNGAEEYLYLRVKKRPVLKSISTSSCELIDEEPVFENVLTFMLKEILDDPFFDEMAERLDSQPVTLFSDINNDSPPGIEYLSEALPEEAVSDLFEDNIKALNVCSEEELKRKTQFLDEDMVRFHEAILDNTAFNLIQESTHKECDLLKAPRTYIMKKP